ncbi:hypothetical protein I7I50_09204 [Histoplasma capsulatum G186AR]|nr:hypothetical protein I7I50_09204 [Histoplasma capsulatum G186AR]
MISIISISNLCKAEINSKLDWERVPRDVSLFFFFFFFRYSAIRQFVIPSSSKPDYTWQRRMQSAIRNPADHPSSASCPQ